MEKGKGPIQESDISTNCSSISCASQEKSHRDYKKQFYKYLWNEFRKYDSKVLTKDLDLVTKKVLLYFLNAYN